MNFKNMLSTYLQELNQNFMLLGLICIPHSSESSDQDYTPIIEKSFGNPPPKKKKPLFYFVSLLFS